MIPSSPSRAAAASILWYQRHLSPRRTPSCRYLPTCSDYGLQAIGHYGLLRGGAKATWRLLRCNPFSRGGYDPPIPDTGSGDVRVRTVASFGERSLVSMVLHVKQRSGRVG